MQIGRALKIQPIRSLTGFWPFSWDCVISFCQFCIWWSKGMIFNKWWWSKWFKKFPIKSRNDLIVLFEWTISLRKQTYKSFLLFIRNLFKENSGGTQNCEQPITTKEISKDSNISFNFHKTFFECNAKI